MGIFRYKVEYWDYDGNNKKEDQGLIVASNYADAAETLEKTIYGEDLDSILFLKQLSSADDNYIMVNNDEILNTLEENIEY